MTGARLAGFWIILHKLHDYCCNIFVSLMRLGSMSRVAKETGYETSFVSRRIAALEKLVGSKLFERTTRLCMPTHEAHALLDRILPYVVDLERRLEMASRAVKATSGDVVLKVRCASGLLPFVVRAIKPFRDNLPSTSLKSPPCTPRPSAASWTPTSASGRVRVRPLTSHSRTSASCRAGSAPRPPSSSAIP